MKSFEYFLAGIFAALGALLLEIVIDGIGLHSGASGPGLSALVVFALVEELAKLIVIRRKIEFQNAPGTILKHCFWIGLGFGLLELGAFALNEDAAYAGNVSSILAVVLLHVATALLTGAALAKLKNRGYYAILAIGPALALHLAFNYWILTR